MIIASSQLLQCNINLKIIRVYTLTTNADEKVISKLRVNL